jgi:hypothetical protein
VNIAALETDLDLRLVQIWDLIAGVDELTIAVFGRAIRASYAAGYFDALEDEKPGELFTRVGYRLNARRAKA